MQLERMLFEVDSEAAAEDQAANEKRLDEEGGQRRSKLETKASSAKTITASRLKELIATQGFRCALTGVELTPEQATLDHKRPICKGGAHDMGNVQWVHEQVNAAKGVMTIDEFITMCHRVVQWTNSRDDSTLTSE